MINLVLVEVCLGQLVANRPDSLLGGSLTAVRIELYMSLVIFVNTKGVVQSLNGKHHK